MTEGPFSENGKSNFLSSTGEEWRILGEGFTAGLMFLTRGRFFHMEAPSYARRRRYHVVLEQKYNLHFPVSILREPQRGVTPFSMDKLFYWLLFSSFSILQEPILHSPKGVTTPIGILTQHLRRIHIPQINKGKSQKITTCSNRLDLGMLGF